MDLGLLGTDGFVSGQTSTATNFLSLNSEHPQLKDMLEGNPSCNGYGSSKQDRPDPIEDEVYRASKMTKWADDLGLRSSENVFPQQQILSFSSSSSTPEFSFLTGTDVESIEGKNAQNVAFSYYQNQSVYPNCSSGFGSENMNAGMHCSLNGTRGTFTPAQWIELEHQTMIYKYICANVPVPSNLLNSIRKQLNSSGFPGYFSVGSYPTNTYGWGPFHIGFDRTELEAERCRRTDGKKWRCSKDAVPDHKYCEKHVKKGRARSRKPVECQTVTGSASSKVVPPMSAPVVASSVATAQHLNKGLQPVNQLYNHEGLSRMHPNINSKSKDSPFSIPKHQIPMDEYIRPEFGLVSNNSLANPSEKPYHWSSKGYKPYHLYAEDNSSSDVSPNPVSSSSPSPTGVLQKASFVCVSNNSSGGCSPQRAENNTTTERASLYEDLLGSAQRLIASSSSIPFG